MIKSKLPLWLTNNLELPLCVAPMFLVSGKAMVIASCKAGVIGSFPFANAKTIDELEAWLEEITHQLEEEKKSNPLKKMAPFAVNLIVHSSYIRFEEELALLQKYKPKIVITSLGSPKKVVEVVHQYGGLVFSDVSTVQFAQKAANENVDGLILVCAGAGGHAGSLSPFAFIDAVQSFWKGIIILAGAIANAKSLKASLTLGADLAYMGTTFIPSFESLASDAYKKMITQSGSDDIINTAAFSGIPANFLKQSVLNAGLTLDDVADKKSKVDFSQMPQGQDMKAWKNIWSAGQAIQNITQVKSIAEIVSQLKHDFETLT